MVLNKSVQWQTGMVNADNHVHTLQLQGVEVMFEPMHVHHDTLVVLTTIVICVLHTKIAILEATQTAVMHCFGSANVAVLCSVTNSACHLPERAL